MSWLRDGRHARDGELMALIDRQLNTCETARWTRHLADCPKCRSRHESLRAAVRTADQIVARGIPTERLLSIREAVRCAAASSAATIESTRITKVVARCLGARIAARILPPRSAPVNNEGTSLLPVFEILLGRRTAEGLARVVIPALAGGPV